MGNFTDFLTLLGRHYVLVLVGCMELIAAVVLVGILPRCKKYRTEKADNTSTMEQRMMRELSRQEDEVCLAIRRDDLLPAKAVGNLEGLLGVTLQRLQEDMASLQINMKHREEALRFWNEYRHWDGKKALNTQLELVNGEWLEAAIHRSDDLEWDLLLFRRITEEHNREEEYRKQLHRAEEASQFKTSFLFRMSHEIRTPMNGITGMLKLAEGKLSEGHPAMQYLEKADELSEHLLSLINDILDMSRIEAGKVELEAGIFNLRTFGKKLYDMFSKTLDNKGVSYAVNFEGLTADWVIGDELRIGQVVINFLSNAVKFTSEGEVAVTFREMMLRNGMLDLMIRVHDTGIGMDPEFIGRIFRPFEQEDASTTRRFGGTGLGMAISDQLVKLMGGQIVVESVKGKGSDFSVILSLPVATEQQIAEQQAETTETQDAQQPIAANLSCRILMAEDNTVNAMIATEILSQDGIKIDIAENGKLAVERFASEPAGTYDLILMDVQMPVMDGRTAAKEIRALKRPDAAKIPIYAVSADAFVEDERLSRESGMNGHLTKPIDYDNLLRIIQRVVKKKEKTE